MIRRRIKTCKIEQTYIGYIKGTSFHTLLNTFAWHTWQLIYFWTYDYSWCCWYLQLFLGTKATGFCFLPRYNSEFRGSALSISDHPLFEKRTIKWIPVDDASSISDSGVVCIEVVSLQIYLHAVGNLPSQKCPKNDKWPNDSELRTQNYKSTSSPG